jgi:hypothetical protein
MQLLKYFCSHVYENNLPTGMKISYNITDGSNFSCWRIVLYHIKYSQYFA